jgi:replication-associated recombination protein RarA
MGKIVSTEVKYRPKSLDEYVFPNDEVRQVAMSYASGKQSRPLLLHGTFGTGKSLLAELIPKAIETETDPRINKILSYELHSNKEICEQFNKNKTFDLLFNGQKFNYFIVEEINFLVRGADALRVIMDKYQGIDLTIFTSNELHKVDGGIKSRCKCLHVPPCEPHIFLPRALDIVNSEGYNIDPQELLSMLEAIYDLKPDNRRYYEKLDELLQTVAA